TCDQIETVGKRGHVGVLLKKNGGKGRQGSGVDKLEPAADRVAHFAAMGNRADRARSQGWLALVDRQRSRDRGRPSGHVHRLATDGFRRWRADGAGPALTARALRKRAPRFFTFSSESVSRKSQALALGRDDTVSCHRARFFCSGVIRSLLSLPKSIATSAVMSAIV